MSFLVDVELLFKITFTFVQATVANIRRIVESEAMLFFIIRTDGIAKLAERAFLWAIRLVFANLTFYAVLAQNATVSQPSIPSLIAGDGAGADFAGDSGCALAEFLGYLLY